MAVRRVVGQKMAIARICVDISFHYKRCDKVRDLKECLCKTETGPAEERYYEDKQIGGMRPQTKMPQGMLATGRWRRLSP